MCMRLPLYLGNVEIVGQAMSPTPWVVCVHWTSVICTGPPDVRISMLSVELQVFHTCNSIEP